MHLDTESAPVVSLFDNKGGVDGFTACTHQSDRITGIVQTVGRPPVYWHLKWLSGLTKWFEKQRIVLSHLKKPSVFRGQVVQVD